MEGRRLFLVRHGETEGQSSIRYHGRNDVLLSESGRQQARALLGPLAGIRPVAVVHSPLQRARESARILLAGLGLAEELLEEDEDLIEVAFGDIEGMTEGPFSLMGRFWTLTSNSIRQPDDGAVSSRMTTGSFGVNTT